MYEQNEVNEAFKILLEEIKNVIEALNKEAKESKEVGANNYSPLQNAHINNNSHLLVKTRLEKARSV